jgi:ADP-ribose pyrophosphatase YjhB (NUDIX family)
MLQRDYPDRPLVGLGAVIVRERKVVLVRRGSEPLRGEWSLPGGLLELGETLRQGVAREVLEETGLRVRVEQVLDVFDSIVPDAAGRTQFHYVLIDFLCVPLDGDLRAGSDVSQVAWAGEDELERFGLTENARAVIAKAIALLAQVSS